MTINGAISKIVCTDAVTTTSIVAKLAVVSILLASMTCANARSGGSNHGGGGPSHFNSQPSGSGKPMPIRNTIRPIIAKSGSSLKEISKPGSGLKDVRKSRRELKRELRRELALLRRLERCREFDRCHGVILQPIHQPIPVVLPPSNPAPVLTDPGYSGPPASRGSGDGGNDTVRDGSTSIKRF